MPQKGSGTDGTVNFIFLPDTQAPVPENADAFTATGSLANGQVTQPLTFSPPSSALNKAYRVQYTGTKINGAASPEINSVGRLCILVQTPAITTGSQQYGQLYVDYAFKFSDPKLSYTDQVSGLLTTVAPEATWALDTFNLAAGQNSFVPTGFRGVYRKRGRQGSALVLHWDNFASTVAGPNVYVGEVPEVLDAIFPYVSNEISGGEGIAIYRLPVGTVYLSVDTGDALVARCQVFTFPSPVPLGGELTAVVAEPLLRPRLRPLLKRVPTTTTSHVVSE